MLTELAFAGGDSDIDLVNDQDVCAVVEAFLSMFSTVYSSPKFPSLVHNYQPCPLSLGITIFPKMENLE